MAATTVQLGTAEVTIVSMTRAECIDWLVERSPFTTEAWDGYDLNQLRRCVRLVAHAEAS